MEEQQGTPMSFLTIVVAALDKDWIYRKGQALQASASGSNKQASNGADSKPRKKSGSGVTCYNCGADGHVSSNCLEPKTKKQKAYEAKGEKTLKE
ncbi:hypothetical protein PTTG_04870 [Puccinia triticina 1-1 BBBD Race 1]|uniref:CCHC-type domain-containing protein n=1 Tax=Puccinia triticina (isolate 1-1 / race 1 (BBBD)) TaxID=630390 RepID=A0A180G4S3_PUCT1|nr:hypothetical protein PTTG_04870 [Puccinia triticina 1-1 BBBD Race 1]